MFQCRNKRNHNFIDRKNREYYEHMAAMPVLDVTELCRNDDVVYLFLLKLCLLTPALK